MKASLLIAATALRDYRLRRLLARALQVRRRLGHQIRLHERTRTLVLGINGARHHWNDPTWVTRKPEEIESFTGRTRVFRRSVGIVVALRVAVRVLQRIVSGVRVVLYIIIVHAVSVHLVLAFLELVTDFVHLIVLILVRISDEVQDHLVTDNWRRYKTSGAL